MIELKEYSEHNRGCMRRAESRRVVLHINLMRTGILKFKKHKNHPTFFISYI